MKMNYLILLLTLVFMVGCTNLEDVSITDVVTDSQKVTTTVKPTENSGEAETVTTVVEIQEEKKPVI